jgi:hypothetical protein
VIANDSANYPSYAQLAVNQGTPFTWNNSTTDPRALVKGQGSGRIASTWYSPTTFSFDLNLTDGKPHQVSLYLLDFDSTVRSETVAILDAVSGTALNTQSASSFNGGQYLVWNVTGHVTIKMTRVGGSNAVVSGVFFGGPASAVTFLSSDTATQGNWIGHYGKDGAMVAGYPSSAAPAYAQVNMAGQANWTWASSTSDPRALQAGSSRVAATWFSPTVYTIDVNLTDKQAHTISVYGLDFDSTARAETIAILDPATGTILDSRPLSSFNSGKYLSWTVSGHVVFQVTRTAGDNGVLSGLFFN